jgi:regulator of RNase E activity RraA
MHGESALTGPAVTVKARPGDLMLGDDDGLPCAPLEDAETIYAATKAKHEAETKQMEATKAGRNERSWVDAELKKRGVEYMA